jgi:hypothetical protein
MLHHLAMSQAFHDKQPFPANWVLSWAMSLDGPAIKRHCPEYFQILLDLELQKFPCERFLEHEPYLAYAPKFRVAHRPAYPGMPELVWRKKHWNIPDILTAPNAPRHILWRIERDIADRLEPYRRHIRRKASRRDSEEAIALLPEVLRPKPKEFSLDREKIRELRAETAGAALILGAIFAEPEPALKPEDGLPDALALPQEVEERASLLGLDGPHSRLLRQLLSKSTWTRSEILQLCDAAAVMSDAALERINDASFEKYDEPLLEGDDLIQLNTVIAGELRDGH